LREGGNKRAGATKGWQHFWDRRQKGGQQKLWGQGTEALKGVGGDKMVATKRGKQQKDTPQE